MLKISEMEYQEIEAAVKANKNKRVAKRLEVLEMRYAKKSNTEIAAKTGFNKLYVTTLIQIYKRQGLAEYIRIKQTSHRRNLSEAEEAEILAECEEEAEAGLGRETSCNYVYRVMKRHGWRKIMPRSKHPKAASQEEQDSSKKLSPGMTKSSCKIQAET